jgi:hypothetical protein
LSVCFKVWKQKSIMAHHYYDDCEVEDDFDDDVDLDDYGMGSYMGHVADLRSLGFLGRDVNRDSSSMRRKMAPAAKRNIPLVVVVAGSPPQRSTKRRAGLPVQKSTRSQKCCLGRGWCSTSLS